MLKKNRSPFDAIQIRRKKEVPVRRSLSVNNLDELLSKGEEFPNDIVDEKGFSSDVPQPQEERDMPLVGERSRATTSPSLVSSSPLLKKNGGPSETIQISRKESTSSSPEKGSPSAPLAPPEIKRVPEPPRRSRSLGPKEFGKLRLEWEKSSENYISNKIAVGFSKDTTVDKKDSSSKALEQRGRLFIKGGLASPSLVPSSPKSRSINALPAQTTSSLTGRRVVVTTRTPEPPMKVVVHQKSTTVGKNDFSPQIIARSPVSAPSSPLPQKNGSPNLSTQTISSPMVRKEAVKTRIGGLGLEVVESPKKPPTVLERVKEWNKIGKE